MLIHKTRIGLSFAYLGFPLWLLATPAMAMPTVPQDFFATDNAAEQFFKEGREQLESEIRLLNHKPSQDSETILQIDGQTQLNEADLESRDKLPLQHQRSQNKGT